MQTKPLTHSMQALEILDGIPEEVHDESGRADNSAGSDVELRIELALAALEVYQESVEVYRIVSSEAHKAVFLIFSHCGPSGPKVYPNVEMLSKVNV